MSEGLWERERSMLRTDLAIEATEMISARPDEEIEGVKVETREEGQISINRVTVLNEKGQRKIGKAVGNYVTLEAPGLRQRNADLQDRVSQVFTREFLRLAKLGEDASILVVGLGNWNVTPDALGPRVVGELLVTRHLLKLTPEVLGEGYRSVSALAPGVLGLTGIETSEIIFGIVEKIKPDLVIAIDALASRNMSRVNTTIQIADTGISPGSGVGNKRLGINRQTLGVEVIAVGVPTVVDAVTITLDTLDRAADKLIKQNPENSKIYNMMNNMDRDERFALIKEVLEPYNENLMVTPKEIDTIIDDVSLVISGGLNAALHPKIHGEDSTKYLN
ncbi:MAG: GPR endopeptidase [Candidatus Syntrophonatronum acetioxidans]|uniref:Germination protease n=1 Tax=Candidatus Syntrophonatronum acetioxidans TaxID=1795816 RepID=A0A424Y982_9FIRM|nr:MAG: GPR endopeptidase [Candidatus Syntrophonatronum acetioxidans]